MTASANTPKGNHSEVWGASCKVDEMLAVLLWCLLLPKTINIWAPEVFLTSDS